MKRSSTILVTGGCGFIGSHFVRSLLADGNAAFRVVNLDKLTYAGHRENLADMEERFGGDRYVFQQGDIADPYMVERVFRQYAPDTVVHFAAESHVDRSIEGPAPFIHTNLVGTFNLLEGARQLWAEWDSGSDCRFHHVSTDEVYGQLDEHDPPFSERTPYDPRSPYSASKAGADHLVRAYYHTYGLPVTVSNCSNNYGPYQYPEKLIPVVIEHAINGRSIPVYGSGANIRDWLYVADHCKGIQCVLDRGIPGRTYNFGGETEVRNIDLVHMICDILDEARPLEKSERQPGGIHSYRELVTFVKDRPGHDKRYAMNIDRARNELGWEPGMGLRDGLRQTVLWYLGNSEWVRLVSRRA